jgi:hypothetical protein
MCVALFTLVSPPSPVNDQPTKPFNLFITAQSMVAWNQMEFDWERGIARE